jgi:hypothetical protein
MDTFILFSLFKYLKYKLTLMPGKKFLVWEVLIGRFSYNRPSKMLYGQEFVIGT